MADVLAARPADPGGRIESLDVVRGFAVLGILAMNVAVFAGPFAAYQNPTVFWEYDGLNQWTYRVVHVLFDLKMMSIFSMLFGAGVVMWDEKLRKRAGAKPTGLGAGYGLWLTRMGWLLVFGMIHAYVIWEGDILVYYALTGALLWWVRRLPVWAMLGIAAVLLIPPSLIISASGMWAFVNEQPIVMRGMGMPQDAIQNMSQGYEDFLVGIDPTEEQIAETVAIARGGWWTVAMARFQTTLFIQLFAFPTNIFWRAASMMLLGAALYRLGVFTGVRSTRFYGATAAIMYALGLPLVILGILFNEATNFSPAMFYLFGMQYNTFGSVLVAVGHVCGLIWLLKLGALGWLGVALAAVGRMALTNYLSQSVICSLIFYGFGLGLHASLDRFEQQLVVIGIWTAQLIWSPIWLSRFQFGPAEWLWRSLTYRRRQPMRRV